MSENIEILNHLIEYLQDKIDSGYYKIFYNDLMYDEKTIDCINAINEVIKENKRLNNSIKDIKSQLDYLETYSSKEDVFEDMKRRLDRIDKIIGSDINETNKEEK